MIYIPGMKHEIVELVIVPVCTESFSSSILYPFSQPTDSLAAASYVKPLCLYS